MKCWKFSKDHFHKVYLVLHVLLLDIWVLDKILRKKFLREAFKSQTLAQYIVLGKTSNISGPKFLKILEEAEKNQDIIIRYLMPYNIDMYHVEHLC